MSRLRRAIGLITVAGVMSLLLCACMMTAPGTENGTPEQIAAMSVAPELTGTPVASQTPTAEPMATDTPTPEPTATDTPTPEPTATDTPTPEPTATNTPTPEPTATNTPTPEPTATNTPTPKPTATNTPTPEPTATNTPTPKPTKTPTPEPTATNTPTPKPTVTPTVTPKPTTTPTVTPKPTAIPTQVAGETAVVIVKSLNVRKSASTASDILGKVYEGDSFPVLGSAKDSSDRVWYRVEVVLDGVAQKGYVFGNYVSVTGSTAEITKEPTVTPSPKPTGKVDSPTPTPSGGKVPTASGEKMPTPPTKKSDGYPDVEGHRGVLNESECLRPGAGRIYAREIKLSTSSKVVVLEAIKSEFNEIWYKVATLIDGETVYGYLQAAAVDLDTETPKQYGSSSLKKVGTGGLSTTHGKDRDGDGVYVVVLDPGHGKQFSGAYHSNTSEHTMTLKVAKFCKEYLESNYENVKVYLTRTDENCLDKNSDIDDLERRVRYAKKKGADVLVSLHFDAFSGTVRGAEGLIPHAKKYEKCMALASQILDNLSKLGISNLGCMTRVSERSRYSYPDGDKMDAYLINRLGIESGIVTCIIEHAHMDNQKDFDEFCSTDEKLKKLAIADAKGIASYLGLKKKETSGTPTPTEEAEKTPTVKPTEKAEKTPTVKPTEKAEETPSATPTEKAEKTPSSMPTEKAEKTPSPEQDPSDELPGE